jgi:hypothetical protein
MLESTDHIHMLRLLDASRGDLQGKFKLEEWELDHLAGCGECQHVREVFGRQFTSLKPKGPSERAA